MFVIPKACAKLLVFFYYHIQNDYKYDNKVVPIFHTQWKQKGIACH